MSGSAIHQQVGTPERGTSPFLKWAGGKRWLAPELVPLLREALRGRYVEPFVGSGAMFLGLQPERALLSDINDELIATFETIVADPEAVVRAVWRYSNSAECYYRVRRAHPRTAVAAAARFLYLNRTAWGGLYRLNQQGEFNTPFGDSGRVICRLEPVVAAAAIFARAEWRSSDFEKMVDGASAGDVVYADPPYVSETSGHDVFRRYAKESFYWEDQVRLADAAERATRRGVLVAVSARAGQGIETLYPGWGMLRFARTCRVSRLAHGRRPFDELVLLCPRLAREPSFEHTEPSRPGITVPAGQRLP